MKKTKDSKKPSQNTEEVSLVKWALDNLKWESFCQAYVNNPSTYWNATQSYGMAYEFNTSDPESEEYHVCKSAASRLLSNVVIRDRIDVLRNESLIDSKVDSKLASILYGGKDEVSLNAIKEYNKLKQRITDKIEQKISWEVTVNSKRLEKLDLLVKELQW